MTKNGIIPVNQAGLKKGRCTIDHLVKLTSHIKKQFSRRKSTLAFRQLPPKEVCRKPMLGVWYWPWRVHGHNYILRELLRRVLAAFQNNHYLRKWQTVVYTGHQLAAKQEAFRTRTSSDTAQPSGKSDEENQGTLSAETGGPIFTLQHPWCVDGPLNDYQVQTEVNDR